MEDINIYKKSILLRKKKIVSKLTELLKVEAKCVYASLVLSEIFTEFPPKGSSNFLGTSDVCLERSIDSNN